MDNKTNQNCQAIGSVVSEIKHLNNLDVWGVTLSLQYSVTKVT